MKANAELRLLSSLVWIDFGVVASFGVFFHEIKCNGMTSFTEFMRGSAQWVNEDSAGATGGPCPTLKPSDCLGKCLPDEEKVPDLDEVMDLWSQPHPQTVHQKTRSYTCELSTAIRFYSWLHPNISLPIFMAPVDRCIFKGIGPACCCYQYTAKTRLKCQVILDFFYGICRFSQCWIKKSTFYESNLIVIPCAAIL